MGGGGGVVSVGTAPLPPPPRVLNDTTHINGHVPKQKAPSQPSNSAPDEELGLHRDVLEAVEGGEGGWSQRGGVGWDPLLPGFPCGPRRRRAKHSEA